LENAQQEQRSRYKQQGSNLSHGRKEEHGMKLRSNIEKTETEVQAWLLVGPYNIKIFDEDIY
jgi:hypothetical protein